MVHLICYVEYTLRSYSMVGPRPMIGCRNGRSHGTFTDFDALRHGFPVPSLLSVERGEDDAGRKSSYNLQVPWYVQTAP